MWSLLEKITYNQYKHQDYSTHVNYVGLQGSVTIAADDHDTGKNKKQLLSKKDFGALKQKLSKQLNDIDCIVDPTLMTKDKQRPLTKY